MNNWNYDSPLLTTFRFPGAVVNGGASAIGSVLCPISGMRGRLLGVATYNVVALDVSATLIIGTSGDVDAYLAGTIPISAIDAVKNDFTAIASDTVFIDGDVRTLVASDGASAAGVVDVVFTIGWF